MADLKGEIKTPDEWQKELDVIIEDPDGWRIDNTPWTKPMTREEFETRMTESTVTYPHSFLKQ